MQYFDKRSVLWEGYVLALSVRDNYEKRLKITGLVMFLVTVILAIFLLCSSQVLLELLIQPEIFGLAFIFRQLIRSPPAGLNLKIQKWLWLSVRMGRIPL